MDFTKSVTDHLFMTGGDLFNILFSLGLAAAIAVVISQIYRWTHRGMNLELTFMATLVLLAPIVAVVMLFIRGDLVLSLGLIGSLSIIRFRTPIKDTRDMVFLFWTIAVGLGCGTYNWIVVIISTLFITLLLFVLHAIRYGRTRSADFVLVVAGEGPYEGAGLAGAIDRHAAEARVRSHEIEAEGWEVIFELRLPGLTEAGVRGLLGEVKALKGVRKVSLLAPQLALPV